MDKLIFGLSVTAVGMIIVFLGLTVLIFCLKTMNAAMNPKKKETSKEVPVLWYFTELLFSPRRYSIEKHLTLYRVRFLSALHYSFFNNYLSR